MSGFRVRSRLREVLEERNWTRQDLADTTELPYATVRRLVKGVGDPPLDQVLAICEALSVEVEDLYWLEEDEGAAESPAAPGPAAGAGGASGQVAGPEAAEPSPAQRKRVGPRAAPRPGTSPRTRRRA